jgi:hypothetical protein
MTKAATAPAVTFCLSFRCVTGIFQQITYRHQDGTRYKALSRATASAVSDGPAARSAAFCMNGI